MCEKEVIRYLIMDQPIIYSGYLLGTVNSVKIVNYDYLFIMTR